ncbi:DEDD exonuclease domain-containing protein [Actinoalloteichus hymeniacidonis]|nr:DEDD exonuclease domain-containing protein [Actinoalloteichus hymeniacidonis]MBB5906787.1 DNA polymerase-3 subunit epsilon [Actinoalloteichus hymeniacidonis]
MTDVAGLPDRQLTFDELGTPLRDVTFVVVDLETTGGSNRGDAITEIGAVKVRGGQVIGEFGTLVNPGRGIPPMIMSLTGITDAMVTEAPRIDSVLPAFLEFAAGCVLVAHNAPFDVGFLRSAAEALERPWPRPTVLCTVRLARRILSRDEAPNVKLGTLARLFRSDTTPSHRALADARATVNVLHGLLERVGGVGVQSLEELLDYLPEVTSAQRRKRELAADLPHAPGVYLFRGPREEVLYVGTAVDLRRRVRQYFTASESRARVREMVAIAERVDVVECAHSLEAEVRELRLLAAHRPRYNRRSTTPHRAWWIVLTDEAFPRLSVVRKPRDEAMGPFRSKRAAEEAVESLHDGSEVRRCVERIPARDPKGRPCTLAEIGRCAAPCAGRQSVAEYAPAVIDVADLFAGTRTTVLDRLGDQLAELSERQRFEDAARRRDRLATLVRALDRGQRLAALAAVGELVAARPDGAGGWHLAVIRHGRLASAGTARRGVPPMPVVEMLRASAETVLCEPGPLRGATADEITVIRRWLTTGGTRLVDSDVLWAEPAGGAGSWQRWVAKADAGRAGYAAAD